MGSLWSDVSECEHDEFGMARGEHIESEHGYLLQAF